MSPRKHIPPSRKRYVRENPTVSIRLTKDLKELLDKVRGDASYSQFLKDLVRQQKSRIIRAYNKGYSEGKEEGHTEGFNEGYIEGKDDWEIWFHCKVCGEPITIEQKSDAHKEVMHCMFEKGWGHSECINSR